MKLENFPKCLWINLDRSNTRRKHMENLCAKYKIENHRIAAVDAKNPESIRKVCNYRSPHFKYLAITLSRLKAIKYFLENMPDEKRVIIFEDDVSFEYLNMIPYDWTDFENNLPSDYGIIQLALICKKPDKKPVHPWLHPRSINYNHSSLAAVMITREAAQKIHNIYYDTKTNKYNLVCTNTGALPYYIYNACKTYAIPIFTYLGTDSTVHNHLKEHNKSKKYIKDVWQNFTKNKVDLPAYFAKFPEVKKIDLPIP